MKAWTHGTRLPVNEVYYLYDSPCRSMASAAGNVAGNMESGIQVLTPARATRGMGCEGNRGDVREDGKREEEKSDSDKRLQSPLTTCQQRLSRCRDSMISCVVRTARPGDLFFPGFHR